MGRPRITEERFCTMEWCDRPLYAKGKCRNCYEKARTGTLVDPRIPKVRPKCVGPGCQRDAQTREFCRTHYAQQYSGRPLTPIIEWKTMDDGVNRRCRTCGEWKDREEGYFNTTPGGKQGECKVCMTRRTKRNRLIREGLLEEAELLT